MKEQVGCMELLCMMDDRLIGSLCVRIRGDKNVKSSAWERITAFSNREWDSPGWTGWGAALLKRHWWLKHTAAEYRPAVWPDNKGGQ